MAQFQINQYDHTISVRDIHELMKLAKDGTLEISDLVKPKGSKEWLYAGELPNIQDFLMEPMAEEPSSKVPTILGSIFILASLALFYQTFQTQQSIPSSADLTLVGDGALQEDQAMLTNMAKIYRDEDGQGSLGTLEKNDIVTLLSKKNDMFEVDSAKGKGWISMYDIAPAYLFVGEQVQDKYDARFNPHRRILVQNSSWERQTYGSSVTTFFLQLQNLAPYTVQDIVIQIDIKDSSRRIVQTQYLEIEGHILKGDSSVIGTLMPTPKSDEKPRVMTRSLLVKLEKEDPSVIDRWVEHIEMDFGEGKFAGASIKASQANAIIK